MIRTRIAPSPTGNDLHIGNLYTALINYAYARKHRGKFIIRIEDTDRERYVKGAEERILITLQSFGLDYDESPASNGEFAPYRQSDRLPLYQEYIQKLLEKGAAYYCFCSKERLDMLREKAQQEKKAFVYDKYCLQEFPLEKAKEKIAQGVSSVIRLNVQPGEEISFTDVVRGEITFQSSLIDDQILIKSDGYPTYHFAVVVDDHLMKISHVIRAEEWISSTPKHVLLYRAFGWELPVFVHLPILRNPDKSKLSKRKNPVWAAWFLEEGYLPEAILNFLCLLGWSHPEGKELFTLEEFIEHMDIQNMQPAGPIFDMTKLNWMNGVYIRNSGIRELSEKLLVFHPQFQQMPPEQFERLVTLAQSRMEKLKDFAALAHYFLMPPHISIVPDEREVIASLRQKFHTVIHWKADSIFPEMKDILNEYKIKMPVLYEFFTGEKKGLPLPEALEIMGKEQVLAYMDSLIHKKE